MNRIDTYKNYHRASFFNLISTFVDLTDQISEVDLLNNIIASAKTIFTQIFPRHYKILKETTKLFHAFSEVIPLEEVQIKKLFLDKFVVNESVFSAAPCNSPAFKCGFRNPHNKSLVAFIISNAPVLHLYNGDTPPTGKDAYIVRLALYYYVFKHVISSFGTMKLELDENYRFFINAVSSFGTTKLEVDYDYFNEFEGSFYYLFKLSGADYHIKYGDFGTYGGIEYVVNFTNDNINKNSFYAVFDDIKTQKTITLQNF